MKLSKDLYDAGLLRRERMGPSEDWGFDSRLSLRDVWGCVTGLLRRAGWQGRGRVRGHGGAVPPQSYGRIAAHSSQALLSTDRGGNPWQPR